MQATPEYLKIIKLEQNEILARHDLTKKEISNRGDIIIRGQIIIRGWSFKYPTPNLKINGLQTCQSVKVKGREIQGKASLKSNRVPILVLRPTNLYILPTTSTPKANVCFYVSKKNDFKALIRFALSEIYKYFSYFSTFKNYG